MITLGIDFFEGVDFLLLIFTSQDQNELFWANSEKFFKKKSDFGGGESLVTDFRIDFLNDSQLLEIWF